MKPLNVWSFVSVAVGTSHGRRASGRGNSYLLTAPQGPGTVLFPTASLTETPHSGRCYHYSPESQTVETAAVWSCPHGRWAAPPHPPVAGPKKQDQSPEQGPSPGLHIPQTPGLPSMTNQRELSRAPGASAPPAAPHSPPVAREPRTCRRSWKSLREQCDHNRRPGSGQGPGASEPAEPPSTRA